MRNSTADRQTAAGGSGPKRKAQGPFRTGAIIPFFIVVALTWAYFHFFFDGHLRRGLEYVGTEAMGAEVDVAEVETDFWKASAVIRGIQVTDSSMPTRNLVQIGTISFQALWDGLLRGKVVIDHADILDIEALAPRAAPGRVLPVDPEAQSSSDAMLANAQGQFKGNVLGDLAAMAAGGDPGSQMGPLGDDLKSSARIAALEQELAAKQTAWDKRLAALPKQEEFTTLEQRLKGVKLDHFKDLNELRASLKELESIRDTADGHMKSVQGAGKAANGDLAALRGGYAEIDKAVQQDVRDLQARFRIPALDAESIGNVVFGPDLMGKVASAQGYMAKSREYLPPKRTAEEKAALKIRPPARGKGRNYAFGQPRSYPLFWLKSATISSRSGKGPYSGDLQGSLTDVTTDPPLVGRPLVFKIEGDFPGLDVRGTKLEMILDHTTEKPVETLSAQVARFPVAGRTLVKSEEMALGFDKAGGSSRFSARLIGDNVDLRLVNDFTNVAYQVDAKSPQVREIVTGALRDVPAVNVTSRVSGTWSKLDWYLATNLGAALEQGFRRQVQAQIDKARARLQAMVNERVGAQRKKLEAQYAALEASVKQQLGERQKEVERLRARMDQAKSQLSRQQKAQEEKLKGDAGKALQDALRR
jgi:uncharacterized protein (TIGR03545 family)